MLIDDIGIEEPSPLDNLLMKETPYEASLMPTASSASLYTPAFEFVENNTSDGIKTAAENGNADAKRVAELLKGAETLVNQSGVGKRASGFFDKIQKENKFGLREDGTPKSTGFLGVLKNVDGEDMTELSMGVEIDGKEVLIPSIVPTLTKEEINYLVHGGSPLQRESIQKKAIKHARKRIKYGQSPFAGESEESKLTFKKPIDLLYDKDRFWEMYDRAERVQIHDLDPEKLLLEKDREAYHKVVPDFLGTEGQLNLLVIQDMRKDANKLLEDNKISHEKWQQIQDTLGAVDRNYWAESTVEQDPLMAAAMPVFIGADYLFKKIAETSAGRKVLKKLGYTPGRSKASAESIIQGFKGTFSGLKKALD